MTDKKKFFVLLVILLLSIGLLVYLQTGIDSNFTEQISN